VAGARWAALAAIAVIGMGAAGCGEEDSGEGTKIALVTAGTRDDADWATQTAAGVVKAARRLHVGSEVVDPDTDAAAARALRRLASDALVLIAPTRVDHAAARKVAVDAEVPTLVWGEPDALKPGLVGDVEVAWEEGAYAAGWMAVQAGRERSVGIVLCDDGTAEMAERFKIAAAFVAGARARDPRARAAYGISGIDAEGAETVTLELVRKGSQMILAACNAGLPGIVRGIERVVERAETGETQLVGLIGEKTAVNRENIVLTSVMVNPAVAFEQAARDVRSDRFGKRVYTLNFENGGLTLLQTGRTPQDAYEGGIEIAEGAADVDIPEARDEVELDRVIAEAGRDGS
jgi:basic membrane lipoprotein Med (substrate-binding protein (PBP1-ABC) superfamily)